MLEDSPHQYPKWFEFGSSLIRLTFSLSFFHLQPSNDQLQDWRAYEAYTKRQQQYSAQQLLQLQQQQLHHHQQQQPPVSGGHPSRMLYATLDTVLSCGPSEGVLSTLVCIISLVLLTCSDLSLHAEEKFWFLTLNLVASKCF